MLGRSCSRQWVRKSSSLPLVTTAHHKSSTAEKILDANDIPVQGQYEKALPFSSIPGPKGVPWFGQWLEYKLNPNKVHRRDLVLREMYKKYGWIVKETVAGRTLIHLFHPEFLKQIYETEGKHPIIPPLLETVQTYRKENNLSPGLGNSNGEEWYRLRTVVQHIMLRPHKSLDYLPGQNRVAEDFVNKLEYLIEENGEISDFNRWVARWGLESAANNCFDKRMGYLDASGKDAAEQLIDNNNNVFDLSIKLYFSLPLYKLFPTPSMKKLFECEDVINSVAVGHLNEACKKYEEEQKKGTLTEDRFRFLSYMLSSKNVSNKDLIPVILSVFTDTLSTTSPAVLYNLYSLASNPIAQQRAYEEAKEILSPTGELTAEGFNSCTYIKACLKEAFRLFPVGLDVQRLSPSNMVIGGYQIPEGTWLLLNNFMHATDPCVLPEPEKFSPERWTREETTKDRIHPYMLTPFSLGRRMCAGRRFAEQELVTLLAKILIRYRLEWHHGELHQRYRLLCIPDQEVKVKFIPR